MKIQSCLGALVVSLRDGLFSRMSLLPRVYRDCLQSGWRVVTFCSLCLADRRLLTRWPLSFLYLFLFGSCYYGSTFTKWITAILSPRHCSSGCGRFGGLRTCPASQRVSSRQDWCRLSKRFCYLACHLNLGTPLFGGVQSLEQKGYHFWEKGPCYCAQRNGWSFKIVTFSFH